VARSQPVGQGAYAAQAGADDYWSKYQAGGYRAWGVRAVTMTLIPLAGAPPSCVAWPAQSS
jgi:hypothetical protein